MAAIEDVNACIQNKLTELGMEKATVGEAAKWLDQAGLVKDNPNRPGNGLRKLIKNNDKAVLGARKVKNLWFIYPVNEPAENPVAASLNTGDIEFGSLDECYRFVTDPAALAGQIVADPQALVAVIRDLTRVSVMDIAKKADADFSASANMIDTISLLYKNRLFGKVTVQCLHLIRKFGNMIAHESENLNESNSRVIAEIVVRAYTVFYEEAKANKLV